MGARARHAEGTASRAQDSHWLDRLVRVGFVAYGIVYLLVGWLALQLAFGDKEQQASSSGAMKQLAEQPLGTPLLGAIALGLFALVLWKGLEAAVGHDDEDGAKQWGKRAMSAGKAVLYAALGVSALMTATGSSSGGTGGSDGTESMTKKVMDLPAGQVLVVLVGLGIIAYGGYYVVQAFTEKFREKIAASGPRAAGGKAGNAYVYFGKAGYTAKGVALAIVGVLFAWAGVTHDPDKSGGLDQALQEVLEQPFGPVLLVLIAVGIVCYGLFCFARALHHTDE